MNVRTLKRSIFQRVIGSPMTQKPRNSDCWSVKNGKIIVDLDAALELQDTGGAIRLEGNNLPVKVLIVHGEDGEFRAYKNQCSHIGHRRLDPVPGTNTVQCCSVSKSTFDLDGSVVHGPAPQALKQYDVEKAGDQLTILVTE